jgi:hypothetical protein
MAELRNGVTVRDILDKTPNPSKPPSPGDIIRRLNNRNPLDTALVTEANYNWLGNHAALPTLTLIYATVLRTGDEVCFVWETSFAEVVRP